MAFSGNATVSGNVTVRLLPEAVAAASPVAIVSRF